MVESIAYIVYIVWTMKKRCICASPNRWITSCIFCGFSNGQKDRIFIELQPLEDVEDATKC
jgi:hypothetical protein